MRFKRLLIALLSVAAVLGGIVISATPAQAAFTCDPGQRFQVFFCVDASPGFYAPGDGYQYPCEPGYYQPFSGMSYCNPAQPGAFVANGGATSATYCYPGTFQPNSAATECLQTPAGAYSGTGAPMYTLCPPGQWQDTAGSQGCDLARPGRYTNQLGSVIDIECLAGFYSPTYGRTSCIAASVNYFVPLPGMSYQVACPAGTYTNGQIAMVACFPIPKTNQTIDFTAPADQPVGGTVTVSATASSGLTVAFSSSTQSVCTVSGTTVSLLAVGTCTIDANQAGNGTYNAAPTVTRSFEVLKLDQTIDFTGPAGQVVGGTVSVSATASSGLDVAFTSGSLGVCTVDGTTVTLVGVGTCSISADQAGNDTYNAAPTVTRTFAVRYGFTGFAQPVDNGILNTAKAGKAVPLKWQVKDATGAPVTNISSVQVKATSLSCSLGTTGDLVEEYAAGASGLQNLGGGYYQWNWATPSTYAKSCKTVTVDLGDGVAHTADFSFTK